MLVPPYGDDPRDHGMIKRGILYFEWYERNRRDIPLRIPPNVT